MSVGDLTKIPSGGIQFDFDVTAICGTTTTMYVGTSRGRIKSLTSTGTLADLTTKVNLNEKIVGMGYISSSLVVVTENGKIYTVGTDGSSLTLIRNLNTLVKGAYYYSNFVYVIVSGVPQELSSAFKVALT